MNDQTHPKLHEIPIGINATGMRRDRLDGRDRGAGGSLLGAQTQRSLVHFSIGDDRMPKRVYHAYGYVKKVAALINAAAGRLAQWKADAIVRAADEAINQRPARRAFSALCLADRFGHAVENVSKRIEI